MAIPESMLQNLEILAREQPKKITARVQVKNPNFKQKIAEDESFVTSEVNKTPAVFAKSRFRAAIIQKLATRAVSKEKRTC